jgi:hypothetical protein
VVGGGESVDPLAGGGEQHPVPGLARVDGQPDREVGLAGAGRSEEHHVLPAGDEVQGAQVSKGVAFQPAGVVEVELLQGLAGGESGGADAALAAVGLPCGDLALQAGGQELLVGPGLGAGPLGKAGDRLAQGRGLERAGQERQLCGGVAGRPGGAGAHCCALCVVWGRSPRSARVTGSSQPGQAPPSPAARPNRPQSAQRWTPS